MGSEDDLVFSAKVIVSVYEPEKSMDTSSLSHFQMYGFLDRLSFNITTGNETLSPKLDVLKV